MFNEWFVDDVNADIMTKLCKHTHLKANFPQEKKKDTQVIGWLRFRVGPYSEKLWPWASKYCLLPAALGSILKTSFTAFHCMDLQASQ